MIGPIGPNGDPGVPGQMGRPGKMVWDLLNLYYKVFQCSIFFFVGSCGSGRSGGTAGVQWLNGTLVVSV